MCRWAACQPPAYLRGQRVGAFAMAFLIPMGVAAGTPCADWLRPAIEACGIVQQDAARLACFDDIANELKRRSSESCAPVMVPGSADASENPKSALAGQPIMARIIQLERLPRGEHVFHLSNGEVWKELAPGRGRYQVGTDVRLELSPLGAYILATESGRATRVSRVE